MLYKAFIMALLGLSTVASASPLGTRDGKKEIRGGFTSDVIITPGAVVDAEHERRN